MAQTSPLPAKTEDPLSGAPPPPRRSARLALPAMLALVVAAAAVIATLSGSRSSSRDAGLTSNPALDYGTAVDRPAPDFTLTDQSGRKVSLRSYRGKVVILGFEDSQCTTICPLTTTAMLDARRSLGPAASQVQLLGVDANPHATSIHDVLSYSELHGLAGQWHFLTGPLARLRAVWHAYGIGVDIERGQIDHTPALFVIDPAGRLRRVYLTQTSYAAIPQLGQVLAQEASRLLPGHPVVRTRYRYAQIKGISPSERYELPGVSGPAVRLGPGAPRLSLFFATWDRQVTPLGQGLGRLNRYRSDAARDHLPALTAIDEGSVEPSRTALTSFLHGLARPVSYPVGVDRTGRVADGYGVQDEPWLVLTSGSGRVLWYRDLGVSGWPGATQLERTVRAALTRAPKGPAAPSGTRRALAGSPAPLAVLHQQGGRILDTAGGLRARVRALRGYPVVVNTWASWCGPCQAEFGLLGSAAARFGRRVAFLGADVNDSSADARAFLRRHPVSYPSYAMPLASMRSLLPQGVIGLPTTFFIDPQGKVVSVHTGQYDSQGTLDQDIRTYGLGG